MKHVYSKVIHAKFKNFPTKAGKNRYSQKYYDILPKIFMKDVKLGISVEKPKNKCDVQYASQKMDYGVETEKTFITAKIFETSRIIH